ncbi:MAG TPA: A/G-specific adenine glycosylase [Saprospiraceae bacterium]|nr:A/G-specific adenine glycosylase [Saprospiraceae bacterium]
MRPDPFRFFRQTLIDWGAEVERPLPWKGIRDPYKIWLSEILLQQTRAAQGLPYYLKFVERFPTVTDLASAEDDEVMKLWEGLGYYARARNLLKAARLVAFEMNGRFPDTYEGLRQLPGVGPYTAAAIASFAYDAPHAVLDGNVFRVLSRFTGLAEPVDTTAGRKRFEELAQSALDAARPAAYNQAIMDFGAMCCTPQNPLCRQCPVSEHCRALAEGTVSDLPLKSKSIVKRERFFHYLVVEQAGKVLISRREGKDIWNGLYEFPLLELPALTTALDVLQSDEHWNEILQSTDALVESVSPPFRQTLTHRFVTAIFFEIRPRQEIVLPEDSRFLWIEREKLSKFAFPKIIDRYLKDNVFNLCLAL